MKKYIEQETAIELGKKQSCAGIIDGGDFCNISANMLRKIPVADVVEVRHGRWIDMGGFISCSICNATRMKEFESYYGKAVRPYVRTNYCPNCGAKMDGGADDAAN